MPPSDRAGSVRSTCLRWLPQAAFFLLIGFCLGLWGAGVAGVEVGGWVRGGLVGAVVASGLGVAVLGVGRAVREGRGWRGWRVGALGGLLVLALGVRFLGLGHELVDRPYLDEGTYYRHAVQIHQGEPFSASFVYPHLLYYADAFVLWIAEPFRGPLGRLLGVADPVGLSWLLLRSLVALLGALTVWPAFRIAEVVSSRTEGGGEGGDRRRVGAAPVLAGLLVTFAPLYNEISHLNISDLPSAFFATLCLAACAGLLERETVRGYLGAGAAAGLAAASKYPAGVVAVAVAGAWLVLRLASRRRRGWGAPAADDAAGAAGTGDETGSEVGTESAPGVPDAAGRGPERPIVLAGGTASPPSAGRLVGRWGLVLAGLAALGVFVAATPSFLVFPEAAFSGGRGIFFGVRQYGGGGWIGVQPESNALFYGGVLLRELGLAAVLAGLAGLPALHRRARFRLLALLPFPVVYLLLISSMNMVVRRNLLPVVPVLAAFAAVGAGALWERVVRPRLAAWRRGGAAQAGEAAGSSGEAAERGPARATGRWAVRWVGVVLAAGLVAAPAVRSVADSLAMSRPSTREQARAWLMENAAPGSAILRESYGPELPRERYAVWKSRFAARFPLDDLRRGGVDLLVLTSSAYQRFLDAENWSEPHHAVYGAWYRQVFEDLPRVADFAPSRLTWGPYVQIRRLAPAPPSAAPVRVPAKELFVPDSGMRRPRAVVFTRPGQWTGAKADLEAGRWAVEVAGPGRPPEGALRLLEPNGSVSGEEPVVAGRAVVRLDEPGRWLLHLHLPEGSRVTGVELVPVAESPFAPPAPPPAAGPDD